MGMCGCSMRTTPRESRAPPTSATTRRSAGAAGVPAQAGPVSLARMRKLSAASLPTAPSANGADAGSTVQPAGASGRSTPVADGTPATRRTVSG